MSPILQASIRNLILSRLSEADFALLEPSLTPVDCPLAKVLIVPHNIMSDVLFLESGLASIVMLSELHGSIEVGVVGREGFVSPDAAIGADTIHHRIEMQMAGTAHTIARTELMAAMAASPSLHDVCLRFVRVMIVQNACTVLSNAVQTVNERLGRWLLMCDDRSDSVDLKLTHQFLAVMLAVRRASVTEAVQFLEGRGYISSERRYIVIRDRAGLEAFSGETYGRPEAEYQRLLGPMRVN